MAPRRDDQPYDPFSDDTAPSISFAEATPGTVVTGIITRLPREVQATDYMTRERKTFKDGNPMMTVVIGLEVQGEPRSLWAKRMSAKWPHSLFQALKAAQKAAGGQPMELGGTLAIKYLGEGPKPADPRLNPAKEYVCKYVPPARQADPFTDQPQTPATPTQRPAPPARPPAPPSEEDPWAGTTATPRPASTPATPGSTRGWKR